MTTPFGPPTPTGASTGHPPSRRSRPRLGVRGGDRRRETGHLSDEAVRDFLDGGFGRHFAEEAEDLLTEGRAGLDEAIAAVASRWMTTPVSARFSHETGIPEGQPLLLGLVIDSEIILEADA